MARCCTACLLAHCRSSGVDAVPSCRKPSETCTVGPPRHTFSAAAKPRQDLNESSTVTDFGGPLSSTGEGSWQADGGGGGVRERRVGAQAARASAAAAACTAVSRAGGLQRAARWSQHGAAPTQHSLSKQRRFAGPPPTHLAATGGVQEGADAVAVPLQQLGAGQGAQVGCGGNARRRQRSLQLVAWRRGGSGGGGGSVRLALGKLPKGCKGCATQAAAGRSASVRRYQRGMRQQRLTHAGQGPHGQRRHKGRGLGRRQHRLVVWLVQSAAGRRRAPTPA